MLDQRSGFKRLFLMLNPEDAGFGSPQNPSGYLKVEINEGKGKLNAVLQNLKDSNNSTVYRLYLISLVPGNSAAVPAGVIPVVRGKGDLLLDFIPGNVLASGIGIENFSVFAILVENPSNPRAVVCPLAAYKDKKVSWREAVSAMLSSNKILKPVETINKPEADSNVEDVEEVIEKTNFYSKYTGAEIESKYPPEVLQQPVLQPNEQPEEQPDCSCSKEEEIKKEEYDYTNVVNPCLNCMANCASKNAASNENAKGDIEKLRQDLDKYFEVCNPFGIQKSNYSWWKVVSPVYLNNILFQCNIKTPLLFNPKVLMSHFKYKHLIFGIYKDKARKREYAVCGIPGVYNLDEIPFGDLCRWVQLDGYRPKYGAFGYWLVYIEPTTGKLLKTS